MRIFFHHTKNRGIVNSEFYKMLTDYKNLDNTKLDLQIGKTTQKNINKNLESIRKSHGMVLVRDSYCDLSQFYLAYAYCQVPNLPVFYAVENRDIYEVNNKKIFQKRSATYRVGGSRVKYFNLPIGDINSPSYKKITEGIDFFR